MDNLLEKLKSVTSSIKKKDFSPYYFLYGDESYFITSIIDAIKKEFVDNTGMNVKVYDNDNFDIKETIAYIGNMPLMNDKKLIIYRNVEFFRSKKEKSDNIKMFIDAIDKAKDQNVIVIAMDEYEYRYQEKYQKGNKIVDFIGKNGILIDSKKLQDLELTKYVETRFKKYKYEIDKDDAAYLVHNAGRNIRTLYSEIDKIVSYIGTPQKVTKKIIDELISKNVEDNVFTLIDYVNSNKQNEAYKLYADLLSDGENHFVLFSLFTSNYESLLLVKDLMEQSKSLKDICDITKFPDWKVRKLMNVNKGLTKETILSKLQKITKLNTDYMNRDISANLMIELLCA